MVEFALVMPVFFAAMWGIINGGFLLYSMNAVAHAALLGSDSIAASGNAENADILGIQRMANAGLGTTALVTVTEIDVDELANATGGGFQVNASGVPVIQTGCTGAGTQPPLNSSLNGECIDRYTFTDSGGNITVTALDGTCASSPTDPSQCPPWPPDGRSVANSASGDEGAGVGASYLELVIDYHFNFFGAPAGDLALTSTTTFRLEPQT
jgi:hypothetical protein